MSFLSKLNPLNWIKELLISDYVGGVVRHALTAFAAVLVASHFASPAVAQSLVDAIYTFVTSKEFYEALIALVAALGGSVANKKAV